MADSNTLPSFHLVFAIMTLGFVAVVVCSGTLLCVSARSFGAVQREFVEGLGLMVASLKYLRLNWLLDGPLELRTVRTDMSRV